MHKLSVITINYNNRQGLAGTFASVFSQAFTDFEYIVIDGGSTDGSVALIEAHAARISHWVSEPDKGIYDAMNKGLAAASGQYLNFLNSGDCFLSPQTLDTCIRQLAAQPEIDILYADIHLITDSSPVPELYTHPADLTLRYFKKDILNHQASLIKASLFRELGNFPLQYKLAGDYWFYLKSFLAGKQFVYMNFVMVLYDFNGVSLSSSNHYLTEMNEIWNTLVPVKLRRGIDARTAFKRSRLGRVYAKLSTLFK